MNSCKNILYMKYPSSWHNDMWREAIPTGNGLIGGLVYGGIWKEIIMLSHAKLWYGGKTPPMPDVSNTLPMIRELLMNNDPISAENIMSGALKNAGYNPVNAHPLPVCDICLMMNAKRPFSKYRRVLNMDNGEVTVSWYEDGSYYQRSFFISRKDDLICYKITVDGDSFIDANISLTTHNSEKLPKKEILQKVRTDVSDRYMKFSATNDDHKGYGVVAVIAADGDVACKNDSLYLSKCKNIVIFAKVFIDSERDDAWEKLNLALKYNSFDYDNELKEHEKIHSEIINAVKLSIDFSNCDLSNEELLLDAYQGEASNQLIEKLWSFGRYLLVSATRKGSHPCNLYGLWAGDYDAMWAFNMFNENTQMMYWQAHSGNMPELIMCLFDYIESKIEDYRENAKKLYNCRGINIPAVSTPESGLHKCIMPHIIHWTGAAGWLCQHYYDYYLFTGDIEFLKERAVPFMYETALFYEDYLLTDEKGYYMFIPSVSPENTPGNIKKYNCEVVVNATMDFAILKELIGNLIKCATITGMYYEKIEHWEKMISLIPNYQVNSDGAIKEWMSNCYTDNYKHRHQSHLYPLFPGLEIMDVKNNKIKKAFNIALQKRMQLGLAEQSGWSLAHMANIFARTCEAEKALECINLLARSTLLNNFMTVHNDWRRMGIAVCGDMRAAPVQIDAILGITAAIQEMLLFSTPEYIHILPALPKKWKKGRVTGLRARGCISVNIKWDIDKNKGISELCSLIKDINIKVVLPNGDNIYLDLKKGVTSKFSFW